MNIKKIVVFFLALAGVVFILLLSRCNESYQYKDVPNILTDTTIDVSSMMYHDLEFIGGWGYTPNGYKGLFIYCYAPDEYVAFERCCTYDPRLPEAKVYYDSRNQILIDSTCCGARFSPWTGAPLSGDHATVALRPYRTQYYPNQRKLRITNY